MLSAHLNISNIKKLLYHFISKKSLLSSGFTLIELLVVIAIIGILASGALAAYSNFNRGQTVRRVALELKSKLRESQNRAVSGLKHQDCKVDTNVPPDNIDDYNLTGHYVAFETTSPSSYERAQVCRSPSGQPFFGGPNEEITKGVETVNFPISVILDSSSPISLKDSTGASCGVIVTELTINFKFRSPTEPIGIDFYNSVGIGGSLIDPDCVKAVIRITDGSTKYDIGVDKSGQIVEKKAP